MYFPVGGDLTMGTFGGDCTLTDCIGITISGIVAVAVIFDALYMMKKFLTVI
jgi:hypothetical protein